MTKPIARTTAFVLAAALVAAPMSAQSPQQLADDATRYMAMGDSLAAGFKAQPATQGYAFLLYQTGVFDRMPHTLFNNIGVVGATSEARSSSPTSIRFRRSRHCSRRAPGSSNSSTP